MVVVAEGKDLVVALAVIGAELGTEERHIELIACGEGLTPQVEAVDGGSGGRESHGGKGLHRVVAVAGIVERANCGANLRTEEQAEAVADASSISVMVDEFVVPSCVEADVAAEGASPFSGVLGVGEVGKPKCLQADAPVGHSSAAQCLVHDMELWTAVFKRREIGLELACAADA